MKHFYEWLTDPNGFCGKNAGKIVLGLFLCLFLGMGLICKLIPIQVNATNDLEIHKKGDVNEVRMSSIEYVYLFDEDVSNETKEKITEYLYSTVDSVKLLHMVNMREHVIFGHYDEIEIVDETTIKCPIDAKIVDLQEKIDSLP